MLGAGSLIGASLSQVIAMQSSRVAPSEELLKTLKFGQKSTFVGGDRNARFKIERAMTDEIVAASYNNFYEFTMDKGRVWRLARNLTVKPWAVEITGEVEKPMTLDADKIIQRMPIEERAYRHRCVEAWAMTVPWTGFAFKALMDLVKPTSHAKYVRFVSFNRPREAVGQRPGSVWRWPYYEALSIEEASNDLTFVASGIYGHQLPKQHGAPLRLVIPWKYGYKSIKSVVNIEFTRERPGTFWNDAVPAEYGFWSNVDPGKAHPRWSQETERLIGSGERVNTLPYNGYGEFVHHLYKGTGSAAL